MVRARLRFGTLRARIGYGRIDLSIRFHSFFSVNSIIASSSRITAYVFGDKIGARTKSIKKAWETAY